MERIVSFRIVALFFLIALGAMCCFPENCPKEFSLGEYNVVGNPYCEDTINNGTMILSDDNVVIKYFDDSGEEMIVTYTITGEYFN